MSSPSPRLTPRAAPLTEPDPSRVYESGKYADLTVVCQGDEYKVHKVVVCPRCDFFAKAVDSPFTEGQTGVIKLEEDDPQAVKLMMHYFYHLDYPYVPTPFPAPSSSGGTPPSELSITFPFAALSTRGEVADTPAASYYDVESSSSHILDELFVAGGGAGTGVNTVQPGSGPTPPRRWSSRNARGGDPPGAAEAAARGPNLAIHARLYSLAEKYGAHGLKALALAKFQDEARTHWYTQDFLDAVHEAYTATVDHDRGMRDAVVRAMSEHMELLDRPKVQETVRTLELSFDLLMRMRRPGATRNRPGPGPGF